MLLFHKLLFSTNIFIFLMLTSLATIGEGVADLPVAPQDEAGLMKTFQTWPRGWFHIP